MAVESNTEPMWYLHKYARFISGVVALGSGKQYGEWQYYDDNTSAITLHLTQAGQFIIAQDKIVLESHSLSTAHLWMRGVVKGDTMLIDCRIAAPQSRRFRMKFGESDDKSPADVCRDCTKSLSTHFPLKCVTLDACETQQSQVEDDVELANDIEEDKELSGDVTLGDIAQVLSSSVSSSLPLAYKQSLGMSESEVDTIVRLCLTDSQFPSFVQQVDEALQSITKESGQ